jgi:hypothetical protein
MVAKFIEQFSHKEARNQKRRRRESFADLRVFARTVTAEVLEIGVRFSRGDAKIRKAAKRQASSI